MNTTAAGRPRGRRPMRTASGRRYRPSNNKPLSWEERKRKQLAKISRRIQRNARVWRVAERVQKRARKLEPPELRRAVLALVHALGQEMLRLLRRLHARLRAFYRSITYCKKYSGFTYF